MFPVYVGLAQERKWDMRDFADMSNRLGLRLFDEMAGSEVGHMVISPCALTHSLLQSYWGTEGETRYKLQEVFGFYASEDDILRGFDDLWDYLGRRRTQRYAHFFMANTIFLQNRTAVPSDYLATLKKLDTAPQFTDFAQARNARNAINRFTTKYIPNLRDDLFPKKNDPFTQELSAPLLVSATAFDGNWSVWFRNASSRELFGSRKDQDGKRRPLIWMMTGRGMYWFRDFKGFKIIGQEMGDSDMLFVVMLPDKNSSLAEMRTYLSPKNIELFLKELNYSYGQFSMPKFTLNYCGSMKRVIESISGKIPWGDEESTEAKGPDLPFSDFIFQNTLYVGERGIYPYNASQDTDNEQRGVNPPPLPPANFVVEADRPFIYFLRDNKSGAILFIGKFEPTESD